jgi:beta-N-acetylhexosaminidase
VLTPPVAQLENNDLLPYKDLIPQHLAEVMVGHMVVPGLTDGKQASLSGPAYAKLREMGFTDVAFTDDLSSMKAITDIYPVPDAVLLSLQAGADIALWVTTDEVPAVLDRLEKAVADNELPMERVNEALGRVLKMKGAPPLGC